MGRAFYSVLVTLLAPLVLLAERRRSGPAPGRSAERWGKIRVRAEHSLWVHAVSLGEVQAAAPLVHALLARFPGRPMIVSTTTATGAQRVVDLFGERVRHAYLPLDVPRAVRRFLDAIRPDIAIVLETELWPNLYAECARRGVPLLLASARLSERSVRRYRILDRVFGGLLRRTLAVARIAAQSPTDRERFLAIGAPHDAVEVAGNLKFDVSIPDSVKAAGAELRQALGRTRPIWVAGSTHPGEESILLDAHAALRERHPDALLVLAPRHPQRFDAVAADLDARGVQYVRRSREQSPASAAVMLVDTVGELQRFYAAGDIAFVGGTLIELGGHNLLEPAALGLPVLCGPHTFNSPDIARQLAQAGALQVASDAQVLSRILERLIAEPAQRQQMGRCGREVIESNRGACDRLVACAARLLQTSSP